MSFGDEGDEPVEISVDCVKRRLARSLICQVEGEEVVLPLSQIMPGGELGADAEQGETGTMCIPLWLARDRGLA